MQAPTVGLIFALFALACGLIGLILHLIGPSKERALKHSLAIYAPILAGFWVAAEPRVGFLAVGLGLLAAFGMHCYFALADREQRDRENYLRRLEQEGIDPAEDIRRSLAAAGGCREGDPIVVPRPRE